MLEAKKANTGKTSRLGSRLPAAIHTLLKEAADLQGQTLSDFVVASAREAAEEAIARSHRIRLSLAEQKRFAEALINPPSVARVLRKAIKNRGRLLTFHEYRCVSA
ncbi:type II toxin-antitoxin system TacA family antitoxin [Adhaeretor mobilis]|uniref:DUF1778 domain-containing protein n=1 Tax=Adhaeretor mobilis TaxID=1930276 RepID=A0A517MTF8_9BACT|nr:DUF1778 domain-containing protein [Adhaeretor mobilis]QDS98171.1 hypothetical protein HG15A2_14440 [Adhaeretor mobilis]